MRKLSLAMLVLLQAATIAASQDYPSPPIKVIVPAAAGGSIDIVARSVGQLLSEQLGQPLVIENRGGASGIVGTDILAKAPPDGYTIGLIPDPVFTIYPHVYAKLTFTVTDFAPIAEVASTSLAIFAHPSVPAVTLQELVALAKSAPDTLSFGTPGTGTPMHLAGELLQQMAGIKMVHVPYKGGAPAMNDAIAGQIPLLIAGLAPALPFVQSGSLKLIAITDARRSALAPDLPTISESGLPGFQVTTWFGFFAPAGTPVTIVNQLNQEILKALKSPDLNSRLFKMGSEISGGTPAMLSARISSDLQTWMPVIRQIGLRLD